MIHYCFSLLKHSARRPKALACVSASLSAFKGWDSRDGFPTATLLASSRQAVGGQICLALTVICEFPVTGPTCQIKPIPALSCGAARIWKALHSDLVTSPWSLTSAGWMLVFTWFISNAAARPPQLPTASSLSLCLVKGKRKSFLVLKAGAPKAKLLTEFRKSIF